MKIGNDATYGYAPAAAINDRGEALVAWRENAPYHQIWASRFSVESGVWGTAAVVPFTSGFVNFVTVGIDDAGAAQAAIWKGLEPELGGYDRLTATWEAQSLGAPQVDIWPGIPAISSSARIMGLWQENPNLGGDPRSLWSGRYDATSGWGLMQRLDMPPADAIVGRWIHASPNGNAAVIWRARYNGSLQVWAVRFEDKNQRWTSAERIDQSSSGLTHEVTIATDDTGNVMAVWLDDVSGSIMSRRYDAAAMAWQSPQTVGTGNHPRVAIDEAGSAIAVWTEQGQSPRRIGWNSYANGRWMEAQVLLEGPPGDAGDPDVAMNAAGQAVAAWAIRPPEPSGVPVIWVSRLE